MKENEIMHIIHYKTLCQNLERIWKISTKKLLILRCVTFLLTRYVITWTFQLFINCNMLFKLYLYVKLIIMIDYS